MKGSKLINQTKHLWYVLNWPEIWQTTILFFSRIFKKFIPFIGIWYHEEFIFLIILDTQYTFTHKVSMEEEKPKLNLLFEVN